VNLNTTLLRERFIIREIDAVGSPDSVTALSNRLVVPLINSRGDMVETFVIRSQFMHNAVRMASQIVQVFSKTGPLMARFSSRDFAELAEKVFSDHDKKFGRDLWLCVYHDAKPVYEYGKRHPFLDVIEKCDANNPGNYDGALAIAEEVFKKMGRKVSISHSANIGMVVNITKDIGRCGLILRNPHKTTTFNFVAEKTSGGADVSPAVCLDACGSFLEGIQMAVRLGMNVEKHRHGLLKQDAPETLEFVPARHRLDELDKSLKVFEGAYEVRYRLERPEFKALVYEAEVFQKQLIDSDSYSGHQKI